MQQASIGLSVILGFLSYEFLGLHTGGLISAGYLALFTEQPLRILMTLALALLVFLLTKLISRFVILYGSRRFMATVLLSLIASWVLQKSFYYLNIIPQDLRVIGYIIPGLVANDMMKQGVPRTLLMVAVATLLVKGLLMVAL